MKEVVCDKKMMRFAALTGILRLAFATVVSVLPVTPVGCGEARTASVWETMRFTMFTASYGLREVRA